MSPARKTRGQIDDRQSRFEGTDPLKPGDRVDWMYRTADPPFPFDYQPIPVILVEATLAEPKGWLVRTVDTGTSMFIRTEEIRRDH